ncbi:universal stress protein [Streptomyces gamaensis]|uniref:Universal stress protein n=1 Tax=Streptomyces gamaensis TaxID=1763542 RepID=A0ABW0Z5I8_9ACTN
MELPLTVGIDGSDNSLRALDWAADEAVRRGLPLRIVHASVWERYEGAAPSGEQAEEEAAALRLLADAAVRARYRAPQQRVETDLLADEPVTALVAASREAAALVTGSSGHGSLRDLLPGSVSLAVAGRSHCPVVVVRGDERHRGETYRRILVGVGDGDGAVAALRFALREAVVRGCEVRAVRAWRHAEHEPVPVMGVLDREPGLGPEERAAAALDAALGPLGAEFPQVTVHRSTVEGPTHKVLIRLSGEADLLVLGSPWRHLHIGLQPGRVGHSVLHHAACPVAVVPYTHP